MQIWKIVVADMTMERKTEILRDKTFKWQLKDRV